MSNEPAPIVVYATFRLSTPDRTEFAEWFRPLAAQVRAEDGCLTFELLFDPDKPDSGTFFEVWASRAALDAHATHPAHEAMVREGTARFGWRDYDVELWTEARGYIHYKRDSLV